MNLTIKNDNFRFSFRVTAIIYNKNMDKIFIEKILNMIFMYFQVEELK